jgi:selenide, water dikinase
MTQVRQELNMAQTDIRLTALAHGGGCGCKLSPAVLRELLSQVPPGADFPDLLVGTATSDDAAVWRVSSDMAVVSTTDFFMPIVDDPFDFGRIAATNALSDVYAMGGRPVMALAILGMPLGKVAPEIVGRILAGGAAACAAAGIPVAGGHSIDSPEPIYGLAVTGLVHPDRVLTNAAGRAGDLLMLTKPLGVGVISAALKADRLEDDQRAQLYGALVETTTRLNTIGADLATLQGVHAMTDVTGFGLLGHGLEIARGSGLRACIRASRVPLLPGVADLAREGVRTGAAVRNWDSYGAQVAAGPAIDEATRDLLCDPQTSGGLLVAVAPDMAEQALALARDAGFAEAAIIGDLSAGTGGVVIE